MNIQDCGSFDLRICGKLVGMSNQEDVKENFGSTRLRVNDDTT